MVRVRLDISQQDDSRAGKQSEPRDDGIQIDTDVFAILSGDQPTENSRNPPRP